MFYLGRVQSFHNHHLHFLTLVPLFSVFFLVGEEVGERSYTDVMSPKKISRMKKELSQVNRKLKLRRTSELCIYIYIYIWIMERDLRFTDRAKSEAKHGGQ